MNNETNLIIGIFITIALVIGVPWLLKLRRVFLVPEGYAGLLYQRGKFVEVLRAGEHIRWGRKFTLGVSDLRKTSVVVPGSGAVVAGAVVSSGSSEVAVVCVVPGPVVGGSLLVVDVGGSALVPGGTGLLVAPGPSASTQRFDRHIRPGKQPPSRQGWVSYPGLPPESDSPQPPTPTRAATSHLNDDAYSLKPGTLSAARRAHVVGRRETPRPSR